VVVALQSIGVKHNIEVAHRLFELPGKCEQIHGHSMWVTMEVQGAVNDKGILAGIEFGDLKREFRDYLDSYYDHHLLLNEDDPFANIQDAMHQLPLPGLRKCIGDPTTENISRWVAEFMGEHEILAGNPDVFIIDVTVWETAVNMARTQLRMDRGYNYASE
jgi:6-pyruvoyl-tetrahydropterin synthase